LTVHIVYPVRGEVILRLAIEDARRILDAFEALDHEFGPTDTRAEHALRAYIELAVEQSIARDVNRLTVEQFLSSRERPTADILPRQFDPTDQDPT
jgi:hypothetical protein